ncbi:hypothetical protein C4588_03990 [Candidatus Parcubacteria bacterium]|nr:MAG: hypothetical protein C4588_03990 [Candidatus Parcubacteria bacterium]
MSLDKFFKLVVKGGAGSGNHGHAGIPGKRGGSAPKGGGGGSSQGLSPAMNHALDDIKRSVEERWDTIDDMRVSGEFGERRYDWDKASPMSDEEYDQMKTRKTSEWEDAFKKKFGVTSEEMVNKLRSDAIAQMPEAHQKVTEFVGDRLTISSTAMPKRDLQNQGVYVKKQGGKWWVGSDTMAEVSFNEQALQRKLGMDTQTFIDNLKAAGASERKATRRKRSSSYSIYD